VLAVASSLPFVLMAPLVLREPMPSLHSLHAQISSSDWLLVFSMAMWCTSGFDSISLVATEMHRPARTLPLALSLSLVLMIVATVVPILLCSTHERGRGWAAWRLGSFAISAEEVGGLPLGQAVAVAALAASVGLLNAFMCTSTRAIQVLAEQRLLPGVLRGGGVSPAPAMLLTTVALLGCLFLPFKQLVQIDMSLAASATALEILALLRLRWSEPLLHRPYRVPLGRRSLLWFCMPPLGLCAVLLLSALGQPQMRFAWLGAVGSGLVLVFVRPVAALSPGAGPEMLDEEQHTRYF